MIELSKFRRGNRCLRTYPPNIIYTYITYAYAFVNDSFPFHGRALTLQFARVKYPEAVCIYTKRARTEKRNSPAVPRAVTLNISFARAVITGQRTVVQEKSEKARRRKRDERRKEKKERKNRGIKEPSVGREIPELRKETSFI